jgi:hypothetical protein
MILCPDPFNPDSSQTPVSRKDKPGGVLYLRDKKIILRNGM